MSLERKIAIALTYGATMKTVIELVKKDLELEDRMTKLAIGLST